MITVRRDRNVLILEKTEDVHFSQCISFFIIEGMHDRIKRRYFTATNDWCGSVEDILEIIPEPYRTALIFNMDLLEEVFTQD